MNINLAARPKNHVEFSSYVHLPSLKAVLSAPLSSGALDLSGIPLTARDMERLCSHLQRHAATVVSLELGFTELTDEAFLLLLPTLAALPHLETLALNGNRLTRTILKELTDALKVRKSVTSEGFHISQFRRMCSPASLVSVSLHCLEAFQAIRLSLALNTDSSQWNHKI